MSVATIAKYAAVMGLGLLAFTAASREPVPLHARLEWRSASVALATALIPVMWTYDGWADLSFMGGEVKNPQRTLPLALILGTACVMLVYLVVNIGFMYVLTLPEMAQSHLIAATAAEHIPLFGGIGAAVISAVVLLSTFSGLNGSMMTGPADLFRDGRARVVLSGRGASLAAIPQSLRGDLAGHGARGVLRAQNDFAQLADKFVLGIWPFYCTGGGRACSFSGASARTCRGPIGSGATLWCRSLFLVASLGMVVNALWTDPWNTGRHAADHSGRRAFVLSLETGSPRV